MAGDTRTFENLQDWGQSWKKQEAKGGKGPAGTGGRRQCFQGRIKSVSLTRKRDVFGVSVKNRPKRMHRPGPRGGVGRAFG